MWQWKILQVGAIILLSCYVQQLFAVEEVNPYCFSMYHTETKKLVWYISINIPKNGWKLHFGHMILSHWLHEGEYLLITSKPANQWMWKALRYKVLLIAMFKGYDDEGDCDYYCLVVVTVLK